jgi:type II secretory pathway pseudopilin PulG
MRGAVVIAVAIVAAAAIFAWSRAQDRAQDDRRHTYSVCLRHLEASQGLGYDGKPIKGDAFTYCDDYARDR